MVDLAVGYLAPSTRTIGRVCMFVPLPAWYIITKKYDIGLIADTAFFGTAAVIIITGVALSAFAEHPRNCFAISAWLYLEFLYGQKCCPAINSTQS